MKRKKKLENQDEFGKNILRIAMFIETEEAKKSLKYMNLYKFLRHFQSKKYNYFCKIVTGKNIRDDVLTLEKFDVVLFPGGDAEDEAEYLGEEGKIKLLQFIKDHGGGYVGVCAGAYLGLTPVDEPIHKILVEKRVIDKPTKFWHYGMVKDLTSKDLQHWNRGTGDVDLSFSDYAKKTFRISERIMTCHYGNGPIMRDIPTMNTKEKTYQVIANYSTEKCSVSGSKGKMENTPAIISSQYGHGRVILASPHPERDQKTLGKYFMRMIYWAGKHQIPF